MTTPATQPARGVLISVLNWNSAAQTIGCVAALRRALSDVETRLAIVVLDNGSRPEDLDLLRQQLDGTDVSIERVEQNLGFAGGHNRQIARAHAEGFDYVWLLNNDCEIEPGALARLLAHMAANPDCGAASPVIRTKDNPEVFDFCGALHDWARLDSRRATTLSEAIEMQARHPRAIWLAGTAVLLRTRALLQIGPPGQALSEDFFAYYEDDDLCCRLQGAGWTTQIVPDSVARHSSHQDIYRDRPPHYFYLMSRNALLFWQRHTPAHHRRWIRYRLSCRAFLNAQRLRERGMPDKAEACVLGVQDAWLGRKGALDLARRPSPLFRLWSRHFLYGLFARVEQVQGRLS